MRKHPFIDNEDLYNIANYKFKTSETRNTIDWVTKDNQELGLKLTELYNFGGVYSYTNINEQVYMIYFRTLNLDITKGGEIYMLYLTVNVMTGSQPGY